MASAELSRRVEKVVGYPPLSVMSSEQRREFHEALLRRRQLRGPPWEVAGRDPEGGGRTSGAPGRQRPLRGAAFRRDEPRDALLLFVPSERYRRSSETPARRAEQEPVGLSAVDNPVG
jgi:hypothetical protein